MKCRPIWYDQADVNKAIVLWLIAFLLLAGSTLAAAADKPASSVPVLSHIDMLLLIPYWITCGIYTIILFAALKYGRTWSPYPLFIGLQVAIALLESGGGIFQDMADTWANERYLLVPFLYSVVVYLVTLIFRKRLRLYDEEAYRKSKEEV